MTVRARSVLRLAASVGGLVIALHPMMTTPAVASSDLLDPDADVRVIAAAPSVRDVSVSFNGSATGGTTVPYGGSSAWIHLPAGRVSITMASAQAAWSMSGDLRAGQAYDLLIAQPTGVAGKPVASLSQIQLDRVPDGMAGVRLLNATADLGTVRLTEGASADGPAADPLEASTLLVVAPGDVTLHVGAASSSEVFRDVPVSLEADTLYTVVWLGAGEYPPHAIVLTDAVQPPHPPPPSVRIETGDSPTDSSSAGLVPVLLGAFAALAVVSRSVATRRGPQRLRPSTRLCAALLAMLTVLAAACASSSAGPKQRRPAPTATEVTVARIATSSTVATSGSPADRVRPSALTVPALGIQEISFASVPTSDLPILYETLPKPSVGWIEGTSAPGAHGVSVVVGHNTTRPGQTAVFEYLDRLQPGDLITLSGPSTSDVSLVVRANAVFPIGGLPIDLFNPTTEPQLLLITCAGGWDRGLRTQSRVVLATLVKAAQS